MNNLIQKEMFCNEEYDTYLNENGDKVLYKKKNKNGFEIKVTLAGTKEERKLADEAVIDFIIRNM